jgi:hypothetical protein
MALVDMYKSTFCQIPKMEYAMKQKFLIVILKDLRVPAL